jgi:hypothetical protein
VENKVTPEKQKEINSVGLKFLVKDFFNGVHHMLLLIVVNVITYLSIALLGGPMWMKILCAAIAAIIIFGRMQRITRASHDRLIQDIKKITDK